MGISMFQNIYKNKKVIVTGCTGFKGSWLTLWLLRLGANVIGISKDIPTKPSLFEILDLDKKIKHSFIDICNFKELKKKIIEEKPDYIFHLAAQAIVSVSYKEPLETIMTNVIGTANILESLRNYNENCTVVLITSDKSYDNIEQVWGYKEDDKIGGKDIYSGSKGGAEIIIKAYFESFLKNKNNLKIGIARAGNVIGGGDWAKDRIVVDCMKSWDKNKTVEIRSPKATRPWQHVLEPLSGYLRLAQELNKNPKINGEAFNFGPKSSLNFTVKQLISDLSKFWNFSSDFEVFKITDNIEFNEAGLLKLNCDKAIFHLNWEANLEYKETIQFTSEWYYNLLRQKEEMFSYTLNQINRYEELASKRKLSWTK